MKDKFNWIPFLSVIIVLLLASNYYWYQKTANNNADVAGNAEFVSFEQKETCSKYLASLNDEAKEMAVNGSLWWQFPYEVFYSPSLNTCVSYYDRVIVAKPEESTSFLRDELTHEILLRTEDISALDNMLAELKK